MRNTTRKFKETKRRALALGGAVLLAVCNSVFFPKTLLISGSRSPLPVEAAGKEIVHFDSWGTKAMGMETIRKDIFGSNDLTGSGHGGLVAIIDDGFNVNHEALANRVSKDSYNFAAGNGTLFDVGGHGTGKFNA